MVLGERRPRTIVGATAALSVSLLLGGCTDGSAGTPTPTVSASKAPSVEPSSAAPEPTSAAPSAEVEKPVPPEAMRRDDVAGAEAAAQYFLELYPYVYATGDLTEWDAMSDPECKFCESVRNEVGALHSAGGRFDGAAVSVESMSSTPADGRGLFRIDARVREGEFSRIEASGSEPKRIAAAVHDLTLALFHAESWQVREAGVESSEAAG